VRAAGLRRVCCAMRVCGRRRQQRTRVCSRVLARPSRATLHSESSCGVARNCCTAGAKEERQPLADSSLVPGKSMACEASAEQREYAHAGPYRGQARCARACCVKTLRLHASANTAGRRWVGAEARDTNAISRRTPCGRAPCHVTAGATLASCVSWTARGVHRSRRPRGVCARVSQCVHRSSITRSVGSLRLRAAELSDSAAGRQRRGA
jgi:hypothetical protein